MSVENDFIVTTLKRRYFALAPVENFPHSPEITAELDRLERAIRELQKPESKVNP